jgi:hypothetical protein
LGAAAVSSTDRLSSAAGQATAGSTVEQADSSVVQANQHHQQLQDNAMQPPQQQQQAATAVPPRYPPGFGPAAAAPYQGRPCPLMMLRGMCPMGAKCPFDHNTKPGEPSTQLAADLLHTVRWYFTWPVGCKHTASKQQAKCIQHASTLKTCGCKQTVAQFACTIGYCRLGMARQYKHTVGLMNHLDDAISRFHVPMAAVVVACSLF